MRPSCEVATIEARLDAVQHLVEQVYSYVLRDFDLQLLGSRTLYVPRARACALSPSPLPFPAVSGAHRRLQEQMLVNVMEHLKRMPDLDRMLNRLVAIQEGKKDAKSVGANIRALICIKHTMVIMQELADELDLGNNAEEMDIENNGSSDCDGDGRVGDGGESSCTGNMLIHAIAQNLVPPCTQPILDKINSVLTESTQVRALIQRTAAQAHA